MSGIEYEVDMGNKELKILFQKIADKDNTAFDDLYKDYSKVIFGVALSVLKREDGCQDVVQLVMSKLYTMPKELFPDSHELTWLYTVTKNEALQLIRKEHFHVPIDDVLDLAAEKDEISKAIDMDEYRSMIKSLDDQSQAIVTLKTIAGFSHKEIGKLLHLPTGTVQWKYHKAIHKLRIALSNFVLFILFGLGIGVRQLFKESISGGSAGGKPIGGSSDSSPIERAIEGIDSGNIDFIIVLLSLLGLLALTVSIIFFVKYFKGRKRNHPVKKEKSK